MSVVPNHKTDITAVNSGVGVLLRELNFYS